MIADILEMEGLVELADKLKQDPTLNVIVSQLPHREQSDVLSIAERNPDINRSLVERIVKLRSMHSLITVGDRSAMISNGAARDIQEKQQGSM